MAYKDILVQIDAAAEPARYAVAANLASRGEGRVTGVYLKTTLINQYNSIGTIGYLPPEDLDRLIQEHNQAQDDDAAKAAAALTEAAAAAKVDHDWRVIDGDTPDPLIAQARRGDLIVLPAPQPSPAYNVHASAVQVALGGGGPVLIIPSEGAAKPIGARALLAWNGSREAARALRDALPLLSPGATIEVRIARSEEGGDDDDAALRGHLESHGFVVNIKVAPQDGRHVAAWLRAEAKAADCDLIVMGLYGHPRLSEFVLGGVSRDMLHAPSLPLLISH